MGLGLHIESGAPVDREAGLAFPMTPEGIEFVRSAATGWADAAIADGDEPGPAYEAAERTIAFYTIRARRLSGGTSSKPSATRPAGRSCSCWPPASSRRGRSSRRCRPAGRSPSPPSRSTSRCCARRAW